MKCLFCDNFNMVSRHVVDARGISEDIPMCEDCFNRRNRGKNQDKERAKDLDTVMAFVKKGGFSDTD